MDAIAEYSASAWLKLTLPWVRLIVAIALPACRGRIPVVLCPVFTQRLKSLSHVAVSLFFGSCLVPALSRLLVQLDAVPQRKLIVLSLVSDVLPARRAVVLHLLNPCSLPSDSDQHVDFMR